MIELEKLERLEEQQRLEKARSETVKIAKAVADSLPPPPGSPPPTPLDAVATARAHTVALARIVADKADAEDDE